MVAWAERHVTPKKPWTSWVVGLLAVGVLLFIGVQFHRRSSGPAKKPPSPPAQGQLLVSSGTIGTGGALSTSLTASGLSAQQAATIERLLKPLFDPRRARAEDRYQVTRSTAGEFRELQYWPTPFDYYAVRGSTSSSWQATHTKLPLEETVIGAGGVLQSSLWDALRSQNVPPEIIYRFAEIFSWRFDFLTEPRRGDTYKIIWRRRQVPGAIRDDEILAAYYNSQERGELYGYPLDGEFFDVDGRSLRGEFLRAPLNYRRISSRFTERRFHPILRLYRPHHGIDYSAAYGTPVSSIGEGTVVLKGWQGQIGNCVKIRHSSRYVSIYGHMSAYARGLHEGSHVHQGQVIGYVGSTGLSTGPHLHFGFESDGVLIDFFRVKLQTSRTSVPGAERARFAQIKSAAASYFSALPSAGAAAKTLSENKAGL